MEPGDERPPQAAASSGRPRTLLVRIAAPDGPAATAGLCGSLRQRLLDSDADVAVLDVAALPNPDAATVDALARVLLTARRLGRTVRLRHASPRLMELLELFGLADMLLVEEPPC